MIVKLMSSSFLKVIRMSTKRLYLIILMLAIGCQSRIIGSIGTNTPAFAANATNGASAEAKPDEQLELNKNSLLKDPSEQIRIKAATVMLFSENSLARKILLEALTQRENSAARMAVCKALIQARASKGSVKNMDDFIQSLLGIFSTKIAAESQLAAEATLIFEYDKIGQFLEDITTDASKPVKTRLNAIQALKLWPDMEATIRIMRLVDDREKQVSAEAEKSLRSLGIPVGENYWTREQNIIELRSKGKDVFLRDWLIRQEAQMRQMRVELNSWQSRYQSALDKIYDGISDDAVRGKFLAEHLGSSEAVIKLWALEKVSQWRKGTNPKLPSDLEPLLVNLISDPDRDVRLKTAGLSSLRVMDSAQQLLAQLETEPDEQVKIELLDALGGACSFALLPSSLVKISPEIRKQALGWAVKYLSEEDAGKARKGAEVIRKLLEPEGLEPEELDEYLALLVKRYNLQKKKPNGALRVELLSAMAGLCAQGSVCKEKAAKLFEALFVEALRDETAFVRETAVDGLIYIDKPRALKRLTPEFVNDPSEPLRKKLINLAGVAGGKEELVWLVEKIGSNSESGPAWQAMLKIFDGSDSALLNEWMNKLTSPNSTTKLSDEQKIAFLKKAEVKATGENRTNMLKDVREKLAGLYKRIGQFDRAANYFDRLYKAAQTAKEKEAILPDLLDAYLRGSKVELAAELVGKCLVKEDLSPDNAVLGLINNYLSKPPTGADPNAVLKALSGVKLTGSRPKWEEWLKNWTDRLFKSKEAGKPTEGAKAKEA